MSFSQGKSSISFQFEHLRRIFLFEKISFSSSNDSSLSFSLRIMAKLQLLLRGHFTLSWKKEIKYCVCHFWCQSESWPETPILIFFTMKRKKTCSLLIFHDYISLVWYWHTIPFNSTSFSKQFNARGFKKLSRPPWGKIDPENPKPQKGKIAL